MFKFALLPVPIQFFFSSIEPQLLTWIGTGAMKSLSSASIDEPDARLLTTSEPNALQVLAEKTPGTNERLIAASPKRPAVSEPTAGFVTSSVIVAALTAPSAAGVPLGLSVMCLPQHARLFAFVQSLAEPPSAPVTQHFSPTLALPPPPNS